MNTLFISTPHRLLMLHIPAASKWWTISNTRTFSRLIIPTVALRISHFQHARWKNTFFNGIDQTQLSRRCNPIIETTGATDIVHGYNMQSKSLFRSPFTKCGTAALTQRTMERRSGPILAQKKGSLQTPPMYHGAIYLSYDCSLLDVGPVQILRRSPSGAR